MVQQPSECKGTAFDSVSALGFSAEPFNRVKHGGGQQLDAELEGIWEKERASGRRWLHTI